VEVIPTANESMCSRTHDGITPPLQIGFIDSVSATKSTKANCEEGIGCFAIIKEEALFLSS